MTPTAAGPPMTLPGGRVLHGWWRDLAGFGPRRLWFGHLVLHRVEALVEVGASRLVPDLARALVGRLAQLPGAAARLEDVAAELAVDRLLAGELVRDLARRGLVSVGPDGSLTPSSPSPEADAQNGDGGERQRRTFYFAEARPPRYLPVPAGVATPLPQAPSAWRFDLAALEECLAQPAEWKARHDFPADAVRLVRPASEADWQAVPLDTPEQAQLCLAHLPDERFLAFAVRGGGDGLALSPEPVLEWPRGAELLAPLIGDLGPETLRGPWQAWCQQRSLPAGEVEACKLEAVDHRLVVRAPARLVERLRAARSDALKGEAWLLLGTGRVRLAAQIDIAEG